MSDIDYGGLEEHEIQSWEVSTISKIYPLLKGGIFHRTSIEGYRGIKNSGKISPNVGQFRYTYPQSEFYFAFYRGYVSLFDFTSVRDRDCISIHHTWGGFFFDQKPITIVLRLSKEYLFDKLIPNDSAPKLGNPEYKGYLPYVEAWYPELIPFKAIEGLIISLSQGFNKSPIFQEFSTAEIDNFELRINKIEERWKEMFEGLMEQDNE